MPIFERPSMSVTQFWIDVESLFFFTAGRFDLLSLNFGAGVSCLNGDQYFRMRVCISSWHGNPRLLVLEEREMRLSFWMSMWRDMEFASQVWLCRWKEGRGSVAILR